MSPSRATPAGWNMPTPTPTPSLAMNNSGVVVTNPVIMVKTEGAWSRLLPGDDYEKQLISGNPERRLATKEEIANIAAFLLPPSALV